MWLSIDMLNNHFNYLPGCCHSLTAKEKCSYWRWRNGPDGTHCVSSNDFCWDLILLIHNPKPHFFLFLWLLVLQQYFENRLKYLSSQENPYPHKFNVSMSDRLFVEKFESLANGEHNEDITVSLAGIKFRDFYFLRVLFVTSFCFFL